LEHLTDDLLELTCDDNALLALAQELGGPILRADVELVLDTRDAALAEQRPWMTWGWPHASIKVASR